MKKRVTLTTLMIALVIILTIAGFAIYSSLAIIEQAKYIALAM